ncbi:acetolactate synthase AlsS [Rothia aerolata]|uniref:Acetolactate synthase n=1 Tax=Rothia aerolata TaxID=1812262 RepID=A0A917IWR6_9MICC|nr:acetolactate synthase AlsS [Rothia aerolata]GGH66140.1 acetolactate synthase [Rothia aerolata]
MAEAESVRSAKRVVETLKNQGVKYVFGIPGAKIDSVYDELADEKDIELVVCRHEQNAMFLAQGWARVTGETGVALVTSGPGTTNLATGLLTANTEQDPVVALAGTVGLPDRLKRTHQSMDAVNFLAPVTKSSVESTSAADVTEAVANAFRISQTEPRGAAAVMLPASVTRAETTEQAFPKLPVPKLGHADTAAIDEAAELIKQAECPVILLGLRGANPESTEAVRRLLANTELPVVETFQASGAVSRELEDHFLGRVGLFRNQPGDIALNKSDLVIAVGYDTVEYDPFIWNEKHDRKIIHIDTVPAELDNAYAPALELRGKIATTVDMLTDRIAGRKCSPKGKEIINEQRAALAEMESTARAQEDSEKGVNPARLTFEIRDMLTDDTTVAADIGSHSIYLARYFRCYEPRHLLFSNGQQTLGVALPWAMAACLARPNTPVVSISGDGGFLFSAVELETATRLGLKMVHVIMRDNKYDMVKFQQELRYGRDSGVDLGDYDSVKFAESFGAKGYRVHTLEDFKTAFAQALEEDGVSIVDVTVDYTDNVDLAAHLDQSALN